ncbi:Ger(x)C family spore germination protein [Paenibacillus montanisoli]|uniref:Ger(X)C family spore germination protein n=1 Tax=Paenibacillus montanisoli TaxID=2081970 RepID=A0A328U9W0_9BACL|nr:Ger(x)C family spore germination protein [Paenibacillus montanisoli]RAP77014.1 Ger(x)C family spore germination protein [Paenibacillus montanisoli]
MSVRARLLFVSRLVSFLGVASLLLTGCWDSRELNQLGFTAATAIDYKEGRWDFSYQIVVPSAISPISVSGASKLPVTVYSTQGKTIREATWRTALESSRNPYFPHNRVIIVSSAAARQGLSTLIDVYLRSTESRETVSVLITDGDARQVLNQLMQLQIIPGDGIEEMISEEAKALSSLPNVKMYDLALELLGTAKSAVLPEIVVTGPPGVTNPDELSRTNLSSQIKLGRLAVLHQDKLVGWVAQQDALGVSFIRNKVHSAVFPFKCEERSRDIDSAFRITHTKTRLTPHKKGEHFIIEIEVKGKGELMETNCPVDLNEPNTIRMMEEQLEKEIVDKIQNSWVAVKKLKTDVVGFADLIHRKYPKEWKRIGPEWQTEFLQTEIRPKAEITIKRVGLIGKSFKLQSEKDG